MWIGRSPIIANATNTVSLWPASLAGMIGFRRELATIQRWLFLLTIPSLIGGGFGAWLLLRTPERTFERIVPLLILIATILLAAEKERRISALKSEFVANVSHELKTPIGALALLAETMATGGDPVVMHQLSQRMLREADRVGQIIDDLLDLSLIEAQESPTREQVPLVALLGEAIERVRAQAEAAGIPLHIADGPGDVVADRDRPAFAADPSFDPGLSLTCGAARARWGAGCACRGAAPLCAVREGQCCCIHAIARSGDRGGRPPCGSRDLRHLAGAWTRDRQHRGTGALLWCGSKRA